MSFSLDDSTANRYPSSAVFQPADLLNSFLIGTRASIFFLIAFVNSLTGNGSCTSHFFDELHWRLTISVNIRTPTTYVSDYERFAFWLQHKSINNPRSLKCEGAVPLWKSCLFGPFYFLYNIVQYAFFFDHSTSTMAAAGPARGELVPDMVDQ